jgi:hypothetical protein
MESEPLLNRTGALYFGGVWRLLDEHNRGWENVYNFSQFGEQVLTTFSSPCFELNIVGHWKISTTSHGHGRRKIQNREQAIGFVF